jgi:hypothetical protein
MSFARGPRQHKHERGQALLETALVLPFVLILILVVVDFGIVLDKREVIIHGLHVATRRAADGDDVATVKQWAIDESDGALDNPDQVPVCYGDENGNGTLGDAGDLVKVGPIDYEFSLSVGGGEMLTAAGISFPTIPINPTAEVLLIRDTSEPTPIEC